MDGLPLLKILIWIRVVPESGSFSPLSSGFCSHNGTSSTDKDAGVPRMHKHQHVYFIGMIICLQKILRLDLLCPSVASSGLVTFHSVVNVRTEEIKMKNMQVLS